MGLLIRLMLAAGGGIAASMLSREAGNFPVVQAMLGILATCLLLLVLALWPRRGR
ncbi:MAG TPA: hypothetical protein VNZ61_03115 [Roseomonas sp.]|nr:hypothetical protein [Roseomonas sp.]